jgi:hypothetical protein
MNCGDIARRTLLQEQFSRLNAGLGVKASAHLAVEQDVRDSHDRHALMMCHVCPNDGNLRTVRQSRAGVIERLMITISATRADGGEPLEIAHRAFGIDHGRKRRGVGRDDGVLAQATFESQTGDTEIRILISEFEVARVVGGFGDPPGHTEFGTIGDLPLDDQPAGLLQQAAGRRAHDQRRHEVFEHGA